MNEQEAIADIIAEMRKPHDEICAKCHDEPNESCPYCGDPNGCNSPEYGQWPGVMTQLAEDLEAAHKRELGDCAKLREAMKHIKDRLPHMLQYMRVHWEDASSGGYFDELMLVIDNALAAPPRNCDRFATETDAQIAFLNEVLLIGVSNLDRDPFDGWTNEMKSAYSKWLFAPAQEKEGGNNAD